MESKTTPAQLLAKANSLWDEYYRAVDARLDSLLSGEYVDSEDDTAELLDAAEAADLEYSAAWDQAGGNKMEVLVMTSSHPGYRRIK